MYAWFQTWQQMLFSEPNVPTDVPPLLGPKCLTGRKMDGIYMLSMGQLTKTNAAESQPNTAISKILTNRKTNDTLEPHLARFRFTTYASDKVSLLKRGEKISSPTTAPQIALFRLNSTVRQCSTWRHTPLTAEVSVTMATLPKRGMLHHGPSASSVHPAADRSRGHAPRPDAAGASCN